MDFLLGSWVSRGLAGAAGPAGPSCLRQLTEGTCPHLSCGRSWAWQSRGCPAAEGVCRGHGAGGTGSGAAQPRTLVVWHMWGHRCSVTLSRGQGRFGEGVPGVTAGRVSVCAGAAGGQGCAVWSRHGWQMGSPRSLWGWQDPGVGAGEPGHGALGAGRLHHQVPWEWLGWGDGAGGVQGCGHGAGGAGVSLGVTGRGRGERGHAGRGRGLTLPSHGGLDAVGVRGVAGLPVPCPRSRVPCPGRPWGLWGHRVLGPGGHGQPKDTAPGTGWGVRGPSKCRGAAAQGARVSLGRLARRCLRCPCPHPGPCHVPCGVVGVMG